MISKFNKSFREQSPTYQLGITSTVSHKVFQQRLNEANVLMSPEQVGLLNLLLEKNGVSMQVLSSKDYRDNSATTRIVDNLEKKQLVKRIDSKTDRRIKEIHITDKGRLLLQKANEVGRKYVSEAVKGIDKDQMDIFLNVVKTIRENILKIN